VTGEGANWWNQKTAKLCPHDRQRQGGGRYLHLWGANGGQYGKYRMDPPAIIHGGSQNRRSSDGLAAICGHHYDVGGQQSRLANIHDLQFGHCSCGGNVSFLASFWESDIGRHSGSQCEDRRNGEYGRGYGRKGGTVAAGGNTGTRQQLIV